MKILHVVHGYHPSKGGCQWLVQQLAERQVQTYADEVTVFTTVADDLAHLWQSNRASVAAGTEIINGVTVRRFPVFNGLRWLRMAAASLFYRLRLPFNDWLRTLETGPICWGMSQAIADSGADIVVATGFPLMHMYDALRGARRGKMPIVLIGALHTDDPWGFERPCIFRAIEEADGYIALTPFERDYLLKRGIPETKVSVIGAGVDLEPYATANGQALRDKQGWGTAQVVCALGKFVSRKRYDFLLSAMTKVWQGQPTVRLVLAGGYTDYLEELRARIADFPPSIQEQITILPDVSEEEKRNLLDACNVFVLPSIHESFGIVFVEAWAAKRPVIGANTGAVTSLITLDVNGLIFSAGNSNSLAEAINQLVTDKEKAMRLGQNGYKQVHDSYTWTQILQQHETVYRCLASVINP